MNKERKLTQFDEGFGENFGSRNTVKNKKKSEFEKIKGEILSESDYKKRKGQSRFENKKKDKQKRDWYDDGWN